MTVREARIIDPTHLDLAEPMDLPAGQKLVVSVVEADDSFDERHQWLAVSGAGLQDAYCSSEPEYSLDQIKEPNPEYDR